MNLRYKKPYEKNYLINKLDIQYYTFFSNWFPQSANRNKPYSLAFCWNQFEMLIFNIETGIKIKRSL